MCISRLCQYFFLSSFLCASPIAPSLLCSLFPPQLQLCLGSLSTCPSQVLTSSSSSRQLCSSLFLFSLSSVSRYTFLEVARAFERWLASQTPTVAQWLEDLAGLYPPMILHYDTIQAGRWALQLNWHHWQSANTNILIDVHIMKSVSNPPKNKQTASGVSHLITPTHVLFLQFLLCMCACMNECMCLCTSLFMHTPQPVFAPVQKHQVAGWFIHVVPLRIAPPLPHLAWFSILSTGLRRPQVHGGARHPADTLPGSTTAGHSQITQLCISCIFIRKTYQQNFSEQFCLANHVKLL